MLTYEMTNVSDVPLYEHLYRCIREDIINGTIKVNSKLPSKRSLAVHLCISINTVVSAYSQLTTEGYIINVERKGYFVADVSDYMKKAGKDEKENDIIKMQFSQASDSVKNIDERTKDFIDFKANKNGLKYFPASLWSKYMREVLSYKDSELLSTVPFNGVFELRLSIAKYLYRSRGMTVSPDQIIIGAGTEYLYGRILQMFGPSYSFGFEESGYEKFSKISQQYGRKWKTIPIDQSGLSVEMLEKSGADIIHVSPANHFPTGIVMPITRRIELFRWANRNDKRFIIEDDYDSEYRYNSRMILPLFAEDVMDKVIYLNTFSKSLVPSIRISYMVLPPKMMEKYIDSMSFYSCTVSSFEQYTLSKFIDDGHLERHISRMKKIYGDQRKQMINAIGKSPLNDITNIVENKVGTHLLLQIHTKLSEDEIKEQLFNNKLIIPLYPHNTEMHVLNDFPTLVINYAALESDQIDAFVGILCKIFK